MRQWSTGGAPFLRDGDRIQLSDYQIEILFCQGAGPEQARNSAVSDTPATPPQEIIQILSFEYRSEMASSKKMRRLLEGELSLAHEVQESLLPHSLPDHGPLRIRAFSKPTRKVGGDFYDFLQTESGEFVGILVDVAGKGVAASLLSSMILGFIQAQIRNGSTLDQTVAGLNRFMCERCPGHFATMFVFTLSEAGQGSFISAGHNTAYLLKPSAIHIEELSSNNTIVGAFPTVHYETSAFTLDAGDVLLIYSDGLTEAENPEGDMLGEEAIRHVLLTGGRRCYPPGEQTFRNFARLYAWPESK